MGHPPIEVADAWRIHMAMSAGVVLSFNEWNDLPAIVRDDLLLIRTTPPPSAEG